MPTITDLPINTAFRTQHKDVQITDKPACSAVLCESVLAIASWLIRNFNLEKNMIGKYCMVRTYSAGVFAGTVKERNGQEVLLRNARRIWKWEGAASLSQLATEGTSKPDKCKFPCEVSEVLLLNVIEIIPITEKAKKSIDSVPVWRVTNDSGRK